VGSESAGQQAKTMGQDIMITSMSCPIRQNQKQQSSDISFHIEKQSIKTTGN